MTGNLPVGAVALVGPSPHVTQRQPDELAAGWGPSAWCGLVLLLPVVAGLAAFTSVRAFLVHGRSLPARSQRLHLAAPVLVAGLSAWKVSGWAGASLGAWAD